MQPEVASTYGSGRMSMNLLSNSCPTRSQFAVAEFLTPPLPYSSIFFSSSSGSTSTGSTSSISPTDTPTTATTTRSTPSINSSPLTPTSPASVSSATSSFKNNRTISCLILEHQDLINRYRNCLSHLEKIFKEAETLRQENTNLRVANRDLNDRLNLLVQASLQNHYAAMMSSAEYGDAALSSVLDQFGDVSIDGGGKRRENVGQLSNEYFSQAPDSPKSSKGGSDLGDQKVDVDRVSLPKSISVRSNGYLKRIQASVSTGSSTDEAQGAHRSRSPSPGVKPQKVHVRGGSKKVGPIELDVYNQGMVKTELCNKWQESGSCPYGALCQFAHGIGELRPVIRHRLYKTEVCRMVLAGDRCPYGHRCHFRHALSEQEKYMLPPKME